MNDVEKGILKELLHLIVDKAEPVLIDDLILKLPLKYQTIINAFKASMEAIIIPAQDNLIEKI